MVGTEEKSIEYFLNIVSPVNEIKSNKKNNMRESIHKKIVHTA